MKDTLTLFIQLLTLTTFTKQSLSLLLPTRKIITLHYYQNDAQDSKSHPNSKTPLKSQNTPTDDDHDTNIDILPFPGAGTPHPDLPPSQIPSLLMTALSLNNIPTINAGLTSMWHFSENSNLHYIFKHNMTEFIESAHDTAATLPTSFYGVAFHGPRWEMEGGLNRVGGDDGWMATQVIKTVCSDGRVRRWQWVLNKKRRPPCLGCWMVESVGSSDRLGNFEAE